MGCFRTVTRLRGPCLPAHPAAAESNAAVSAAATTVTAAIICAAIGLRGRVWVVSVLHVWRQVAHLRAMHHAARHAGD